MGTVIRKILIAEDDVEGGAMLAQYLALSGHEVRIAQDGREAEEILSGHDPDVLILDLNLPQVDGWTLARRIRSNPAYTSRPLLIALSGYNSETHRERSRDAGFDYHLGKPVAPPVLLGLVERGPEELESEERGLLAN